MSDPTPNPSLYSQLPESELSSLNRRQLLMLGAGMVTLFVSPTSPANARTPGSGGGSGSGGSGPNPMQPWTGDFPQPLDPGNLGTFSDPVELAVKPITQQITPYPDQPANQQEVVVQRYYQFTDGVTDQGEFNHTLSTPLRPGPTFRFRAADPSKNTLNLNFQNELPPNTCYPINPEQSDPTKKYASNPPFPSTGCEGVIDKPKCFNTVNMHFHGLHVSPLSLSKKSNQPVCGAANKDAILSSDDVLYALHPKGQEGSTGEHRYCVTLPTFHAPGTHWYHDHTHGATALHVIDGMAGALIVEEEGEYEFKDPNNVDQLLYSKDLVWLLQEVINPNLVTNIPKLKTSGSDEPKYQAPTDQTVYNCGSSSKQFTVNGVYQPTLTMTTTDVHRWRFINATATPRGFIKLKLMGPKTAQGNYLSENYLYLIATDGISFYGKRPKALKEIDLSPANRADFLVQIPKPGEYALVKEEVKIQGTAFSFPGGPQNAQVIAKIQVSGKPVGLSIPFNYEIPGKPPEYLKPITDDQLLKNPDGSIYCRPVVFNIQLEGKSQGCFTYESQAYPTPRAFGVNGQTYTEKTGDDYVSYVVTDLRDDQGKTQQKAKYNSGEFKYEEGTHRDETVQVVKLNTCEEWILLNYSNLVHPFHIHVNPFQVVETYNPNASGTATDPKRKTFDVNDGVWYDTIGIPPGRLKDADFTGDPCEPGYVKIRSRFWDYWGEYVFHCHILTHEDLGMMQNVYVANDGTGQGPCKQLDQSPPVPPAIGCKIGESCALPPSCYPPSYWPGDKPKPSFEVFRPLDKNGKLTLNLDGTEPFPPSRGADCLPGGKACEAS